MPDISLTDAIGLNLDGSLAPGAKLTSLLPRFLNLKDLPLDQVPFQEGKAGLNFTRPIDVPAADMQLQIGVSGGGSLALIGARRGVLDDYDPFNTIAINPGEIYLVLSLDFSVNAGIDLAAGWVSFGFSAEKSIEIKSYRRFQSGAAGFPHFSQALAATASSFLIPRSVVDLDRLQSDTVLVIAGTGVLTASAGFTISLPVQTLAAVNIPAVSELQVKASGSFNANVSLTLTGGYQIRLRRIGSRKIELGVYRIKSREIAVRVSAQAGVTAGAGGFELVSEVLSALSPQPVVDVNEFQQALPGEDQAARERRIEAFQSKLQTAVNTKLQVAVGATFSALHSDEAAWLFEIDFNIASSDAAKTAITSALKGDFTALTAGPKTLPPGIVQTENILTRTDLHKQVLRVNLLGILNFLSATTIARVSTIELNAAGEITLITDTSSASRLQALLLNAGMNAKRLRKMLSENFLIEASYHAANVGVLPPGFRSSHTFFEIHDQTSRSDMKDNLDVARVLALISPTEEDRRLSQDNFGRTTFYAETRYNDQSVKRIFLDDLGHPRSVEDYENAGRSALGALLKDDRGQEFRQRFADLETGGALWNEMKRIGNVALFAPLFGLPAGSSDPRVAAAGSDFITITTWAAAMNKAAVAIHEVQSLLGGGGIQADDARLTQAREHLKSRMEDVVKDTHEHFGDPLGLIMVYIASGQSAGKTVIAAGPQIERLEVSSQSEFALHA
jgi:hypothetical protein